MASNWPPSTTPSSDLYQEHTAAEPLTTDQMDMTPALSQSFSPNISFGGARVVQTFACAYHNPSSAIDLDEAFNPTVFDQPFNGRFLCNILGCPSTFTRKADRDRHVQSWHNRATLHLCPVHECEKSAGKPYSRKDKLLEHMRKKHAGVA
ncbi:hypothetical protein DL98DRAFT_542830 [Cadophora sp. DSE1049]|nr:hypothetical protein DL98DRAFT_542830 [Cadophora sp. DSE1049]